MTLQTSVLGSLPRSIGVLNQFRDYDNVYRNPTALALLEQEAKEMILKQENLGLDIGKRRRDPCWTTYWDQHVGQAYRVWERPGAHGGEPHMAQISYG